MVSSLKRIAILGSTGSIGQSALAVVDAHADRLTVVGLAAGENADLLGEQIARYRPTSVSMASGDAIDRLKQNGSTRDMIFPVAALVSYISRFMSLQPGDVILTGTPAGVGLGQKPPAYLQPGDVVTASIDGLGEQTHRVVASR